MNQMLGDILLLPAQELFNELLRSDRYISRSLGKFRGRALGIRCSQPALEFVVSFEPGSVRLIAGNGASAGVSTDATVCGNPLSLLTGLTQGDKPVTRRGIEVKGDAEFLLDLQHCLASLDIRWDDYLAPLVGDVLTQQLAQAGKELGHWSTGARENLRRNLRDYLHEEARLVAGRQQVRRFDRELADLKLSIDRAEARLERIQSRLQAE